MSKIVITSTEEFDEITLKLNDSLNRIREIFDEDKRTMDDILTNPSVWSGRARNKTDEKFQEFSSYYPSITESLENFVRFLAETSEKYKAFEASVDRSIENNEVNLNVN